MHAYIMYMYNNMHMLICMLMYKYVCLYCCINMHAYILYNTLLNSDRLIGCLWSRDIE